MNAVNPWLNKPFLARTMDTCNRPISHKTAKPGVNKGHESLKSTPLPGCFQRPARSYKQFIVEAKETKEFTHAHFLCDLCGFP
jgi:hypothetical protein